MSLETKRDKSGAALAEGARFDPVPGRVVAGKYRIDRALGEGGMGIVVAATHLDLEQRVAIKFLLPEAMRSHVAIERFLREARVAAKVRSEYVARVHDVGTLEGDVPYIVMEYLEGSDLGQLIDAGGALPIDEACEIALQACEALAEVHAAGIVHRDLKPSNLFVTRHVDGSPAAKLLDFGISKLIVGDDRASADPALTATATIMGSPSYMSPEQLKSTKEVDSRTDVWSLGAVLYEATTGRAAFRGESVPQVCALIASEDPAPPAGLRDGLPPELQGAILACLEKDPDKRMTLVGLATVLAKFAPARALRSLDRIAATLGAPASSSRAPASDPAVLPVLPLASLARSRTGVAWGRANGRGTRPGVLLLWLVGVLGGLLGVGVFTGRVPLRAWRAPWGVTRMGSPSAGAAAPAAPSSAPGIAGPAAPSAQAAPSAEAPSFAEPDDDGGDGQAPAPSDSASAAATARPSMKPRPKAPRHPAKLVRRRRH